MGKGMTEANRMQHVSVECGNVEGRVEGHMTYFFLMNDTYFLMSG
jgi:hypothetical protein